MDVQIQQASAKSRLGDTYSTLASLAARQTFGAIDVTAPRSDGSMRFFMKDIGSSRQVILWLNIAFVYQLVGSRVNFVEAVYASFPALLYFNSSVVKPLLLPLLEQQSDASHPFAASDIGQSTLYDRRLLTFS